MLGGFYGKVTNYGPKRWRGELFYNGLNKPLFCVYCQNFTKKEAEKHLYEQATQFLRDNKTTLAKTIQDLFNQQEDSNHANIN